MFGVKMISNIHTYAKTAQMKSQWQQKQDSGDITAKLDVFTRSPVKEETQSIVEALTAELPEENSLTDQNKMLEIKQKMLFGSALSEKDKEYLKKNAPELYDEYMQAEQERKQEEKEYKEALRRCETKEEVDRVKTAALNRYMIRTKYISNNPNIDPEKKALKIAAEKRKAEDVDRNTKEFVRKGEYEKLPNEAEVMEARKEIAEERRAALGVPEREPIRSMEKEQDAVETKKTDTDRTEKRIDIESDAERKMRRAKARAAYEHLRDDGKDAAASEWSRSV